MPNTKIIHRAEPKGYRPERPHRHDKPGRYRRWAFRLGQGSVIQCECGRFFILADVAYATNKRRLEWIEIDRQSTGVK